MALRKLVAGNWKMHGLSSDLAEIKAIADAARDYPQVDVALCVPAILIERAARAVPGFAIGGQDVHQAEKGAHTGCVSAHMLLDAGASLTIVGHSERREAQRESDEEVKAKAEAALGCGLDIILCVGESLAEREAGRTEAVLQEQFRNGIAGLTAEQLSSAVIAYEPVWAIGTGKTATPDMAADAHRVIRDQVRGRFGNDLASAIRVLYGGSVKPDNIKGLMAQPDIDGALVGGASLEANSFASIVNF